MNINEIVQQYQRLLFSIAYQMTGEVTASEDIVQEAFTNWMTHEPENIHHPKAYLTKSVTNRALNYLAEAKRRRDSYKGTWLPEPVIENAHHQVEAQLDLSYSFMLLLEKLTPTERAVFLLKESFELDYEEIANMLEMTLANSRQLYHRAKEKVAQPKSRFTFDVIKQQQLLQTFRTASETGDISDFLNMLKEDIAIYSDGGGKVSAALHPLFGKRIAGKFMQGLIRKAFPYYDITPVVANGTMAFVLTLATTRHLESVLLVESNEQGISNLYFVRNPDKLAHVI